MGEYTVKDKVAIIGLGETKYYKRGQAPVPEFRLACEAIIKAADDAGIDVREIDGISGYADDRNDGQLVIRRDAHRGIEDVPEAVFAGRRVAGPRP